MSFWSASRALLDAETAPSPPCANCGRPAKDHVTIYGESWFSKATICPTALYRPASVPPAKKP